MKLVGILFCTLALLSPYASLLAGQPVIDVHLHVYGDDYLPYPKHPNATVDFVSVQSHEELISATVSQMDKHNIVLALLHDSPTNSQTLHQTEPDRFLVFPDIKSSTLAPSLKVFQSKLGSAEWGGIGEIRTVYNGLRPDDASLWPLYEVANIHDVPIFWHTGGSFPGITRRQPLFRMDYGRPLHWEDIFVKYPDLRVVLAHAGYPYLDEMMAILRQYPSVHVDTGAVIHMFPLKEVYRYFGTLIDAGFGDRILFGSDQMGWPDAIGYSIEVIKNAPWDEKVKRNILYHNATRFLRLSEEKVASYYLN